MRAVRPESQRERVLCSVMITVTRSQFGRHLNLVTRLDFRVFDSRWAGGFGAAAGESAKGVARLNDRPANWLVNQLFMIFRRLLFDIIFSSWISLSFLRILLGKAKRGGGGGGVAVVAIGAERKCGT